MAAERRIESYLLDGAAGKLEALLEEPESVEPREACLICHPHPLHGGTMHNKVVYRMARALRSSGSVVLRFNFRGVGRSEGQHDKGAGELADARLMMDWLRARYPELPYSAAGFSFGARIALRLACSLRRRPAGDRHPVFLHPFGKAWTFCGRAPLQRSLSKALTTSMGQDRNWKRCMRNSPNRSRSTG